MLKEIARWWREKTGPGKIAILATTLLGISQFFVYYEPHNFGVLSIRSDFSTVGTYWFDPVKGGTGWQIHPWAYLVLLTLITFHFSSISQSRLFLRFGYWLSIPIAFAAVTPGSIGRPGAKMGLIALGMFLIAAIWNQFRNKQPVHPAAPPPPAG